MASPPPSPRCRLHRGLVPPPAPRCCPQAGSQAGTGFSPEHPPLRLLRETGGSGPAGRVASWAHRLEPRLAPASQSPRLPESRPGPLCSCVTCLTPFSALNRLTSPLLPPPPKAQKPRGPKGTDPGPAPASPHSLQDADVVLHRGRVSRLPVRLEPDHQDVGLHLPQTHGLRQVGGGRGGASGSPPGPGL